MPRTRFCTRARARARARARFHARSRTLVFGLALLLAGCAGPSRPAPPPPTLTPAPQTAPARTSEGHPVLGLAARMAPRCHPARPWRPGEPAFTEVTEAAGLTTIGAAGTRIGVTDLDGDGWADLIIRAGSSPDDFSAGGARATWLLRNQRDGSFADVTRSSGLVARRVASGELGRPTETVAFADVDNDGDLDAFAAATGDGTGTESCELLLNDGTGHFALGPADDPARRAGQPITPAGVTFVDYDRDGRIDLLVADHGRDGMGAQDHLYRGSGDGRFVDVTADAGLITRPWDRLDDLDRGLAHSRAWASAACDLDDDGLDELLIASYGRSPDHLWHARRAGDRVVFDNQSVASGYAYDDDQSWTDNQFARCYCRDHRDAEGCAEVPEPSIDCFDNWDHVHDRHPFRLGGNSATTLCADLDGDGDLDLVTTEIKHWWAGAGADGSEVLVNTGARALHFDRPGDRALGLAIDHPAGTHWDEGHMTAAILDFDNDGWPDIYLGGSDYPGNRGLLYHHRDAIRDRQPWFEEVAPADFFLHYRSHGVVAADFDRDGDLDLVVGHSHARCGHSDECYPTTTVRMFANRLADRGNWFQLELSGGPGSNRAAIGARVTVTAGGVTQTQEVDGGHGHFGSQNDRVLHFGLGGACTAEVAVRWPDAAGATERFAVPAGYRIYKRQGEPALVLAPPGQSGTVQP